MKSNKIQTITSQSKTSEASSELSDKELGRIYRRYHPQEHDLFDAVDDEYMKRFEMLFGAEVEWTVF